jgi:hypothetical protein
METISKAYDTSVENGKTTITIRESGEDGMEKRVCFREVENGWVIDISKEYYEGEGERKQWRQDNKSYISFENPIDAIKDKVKSKEKKQKESMSELLGSIDGMLGSMII